MDSLAGTSLEPAMKKREKRLIQFSQHVENNTFIGNLFLILLGVLSYQRHFQPQITLRNCIITFPFAPQPCR